MARKPVRAPERISLICRAARAVSLGVASSAMADDIDLVNINPAGIASLSNGSSRSGSLFLSHQELFLDSNLSQFGSAMPMGRTTAAGLNVTRLAYADSEGRNANGAKTAGVEAGDLSVGAALARRFGGLRLGAQAKIIYQQLGSQSARGAALDLGFVSNTPVARLSLGGGVRNLGTKMRFVNDSYALPLTVSMGSSYRVSDIFSLGLGVETLPYRNKVNVAIGSEIQAGSMLSVRTGYLTEDAPVGIDGLAGGIGLQMKNLKLDYAVKPFGELGTTHTISLTSHFNLASPAVKSTPAPASELPNRLDVDIDSDKNPFTQE